MQSDRSILLSAGGYLVGFMRRQRETLEMTVESRRCFQIHLGIGPSDMGSCPPELIQCLTTFGVRIWFPPQRWFPHTGPTGLPRMQDLNLIVQ